MYPLFSHWYSYVYLHAPICTCSCVTRSFIIWLASPYTFTLLTQFTSHKFFFVLPCDMLWRPSFCFCCCFLLFFFLPFPLLFCLFIRRLHLLWCVALNECLIEFYKMIVYVCIYIFAVFFPSFLVHINHSHMLNRLSPFPVEMVRDIFCALSAQMRSFALSISTLIDA